MNPESFSYWQQNAPAVPLSTELPYIIDFAIIGGGLLGAATCYWLAREGVRVALLERTVLASGATGRNGGFVVAGPVEGYPDAIQHLGYETANAVMKLTYDNRALLRQVVQEEEITCEYREPGTVRLALTEADIDTLKREVETLRADGFPAEFLDRDDVQPLMKVPLGPQIIGGRFLPAQGLVHPARFVQGLMHAARRHGAQAYQAEVSVLVPEGKHVCIQTSRGPLYAGMVVVAVNAWTRKILPELTDIIVPVREQMLAYAPIGPVFTTGVSATVTTHEYWQQTTDGTILIGGCGSVAPGEDIGVWEDAPTAAVQEAIEQVLPDLFPSLTSLQVVQRWAGLLGCTTDNHPIVDHAPNMPNVLFVGGFSGHGMPFGLRFGQLLTTAIQNNGELPSALTPFRLNRPTLRKWEHQERENLEPSKFDNAPS